jgi:hypothetical protein
MYIHRCLTGALVIKGFELVPENLGQIGTNEFLPQPARLAASARHRPSRLYRRQKLGRRNQSAVSAEFFPFFTRRSFPTGIRDGGRREPREPRRCSLGRRNVYRDLATAGIPPQVQESPVRGSNGGALGCNESTTLPRFCAALVIVKPETLIGWHRKGFQVVLEMEVASWSATNS